MTAAPTALILNTLLWVFFQGGKGGHFLPLGNCVTPSLGIQNLINGTECVWMYLVIEPSFYILFLHIGGEILCMHLLVEFT